MAAIALIALILLAQLDMGLIIAYAITESATYLVATTIVTDYAEYAYNAGGFATSLGVAMNNLGLIYLRIAIMLIPLGVG